MGMLVFRMLIRRDMERNMGKSGIVWVILLMIVGLKEMNEYSVGKTVAVVLLTVFTMAVIWATIVLLFTISSQFVTMIREVYYEIVYRL